MCSRCTNIQRGGNLQDIGPLVRNRRVYQRGGAFLPPPQYYFYYSPYNHRGRGIGSVFFKFFKAVSPMLVKGLRSVGKEAIAAGADILADKSGKPFSQILRSRTSKAVTNLRQKAENKIQKAMEGSGQRGIKRRHTSDLDQSLVAIKPGRKRKRLLQKKKSKKIIKKSNKDIFDN